MGTYMMDHGRMMVDMEMVLLNGLMVTSIKVIGSIIKNRGLEYILEQMEINTKVNGQMIKSMVMVHIHFQMEINIMDNGKIIKEMDLE